MVCGVTALRGHGGVTVRGVCAVTALRGHGMWGYCLKRPWYGVTALRGHGMWGYCLKRPWYVGLLP